MDNLSQCRALLYIASWYMDGIKEAGKACMHVWSIIKKVLLAVVRSLLGKRYD
jgi:hypothetical protein